MRNDSRTGRHLTAGETKTVFHQQSFIKALLFGLVAISTFGVSPAQAQEAEAPAEAPAEATEEAPAEATEHQPDSCTPDAPSPSACRELLGSSEPSERATAIRALGRLGEEAVPALIQALENDPVIELRGWAARSLHRIGTDEALEAIRRAASQDRSPHVRRLAATLLGEESEEQEPTPPVELASASGREADALQLRRDRGLILSGWIIFGVNFGLATVGGIATSVLLGPFGLPLFMPFLGPSLFTLIAVNGSSSTAQALQASLTISGIAQIVGFTLLCVGHRRQRRRSRAVEEDESSRISVAFAPQPGGFSLVGTF